MRPGKRWRDKCRISPPLLSRKPGTERSAVEGYPGTPAQETAHEAGKENFFRRGSPAGEVAAANAPRRPSAPGAPSRPGRPERSSPSGRTSSRERADAGGCGTQASTMRSPISEFLRDFIGVEHVPALPARARICPGLPAPRRHEPARLRHRLRRDGGDLDRERIGSSSTGWALGGGPSRRSSPPTGRRRRRVIDGVGREPSVSRTARSTDRGSRRVRA